MKKIIVIIFVLCFCWYAYMAYFMNMQEYGISPKAPIGNFSGLNSRLSHSRFKKVKKSLGNGLKAYWYLDQKKKKQGPAEKVVLIADQAKNIKGVVIYYKQDAQRGYKSPIARFFMRYWKQLNGGAKPHFEDIKGTMGRYSGKSQFAKNGMQAYCLRSSYYNGLSCASFHLTSSDDPVEILDESS